MGAAPRHGRVLRVRRAADPPDAARTAGARRRAGRTRCGRRRQLRVPGVRRAIGDADASGPQAGRRRGGGAAAARRGLRRGQPPRARHGPRRRARPRTAVLRRGVRRARRTRRCHRARTSRRSARRCGRRSATRPGSSRPSAPDRASRSPRSPPGWPNPTASGWSAATRNATLLDGLPVRRLWGIGPVAEEKLHRLGIETIGALAALSDAEVANILGGTVGPALHQLARGIDDRPVAENGPAKQISAESTFPEDLTTLDQLREAAGPIGEHAHARLEKDGRGARTVTVKLKKSDMSTLTRSATLPYATTDAATLIAHGAQAAARPARDRPDSPCRRWLFGSVGRPAGVAVPRSGADGRRGVRHRAAADAHRSHRDALRPGASATTSCTPTTATAGCRARATA